MGDGQFSAPELCIQYLAQARRTNGSLEFSSKHCGVVCLRACLYVNEEAHFIYIHILNCLTGSIYKLCFSPFYIRL